MIDARHRNFEAQDNRYLQNEIVAMCDLMNGNRTLVPLSVIDDQILLRKQFIKRGAGGPTLRMQYRREVLRLVKEREKR